jgi:hypothetical protein
MKIRLFFHAPPHARKKDLRISFISHDLGSAYTLPTPQEQSLDQGCRPGLGQEVKAP